MFSCPPPECPSNCSNCGLAGRCLECDDGFAKITFLKRKNKTICVPCGQQLSNKRKGLDRDSSKCPAGKDNRGFVISFVSNGQDTNSSCLVSIDFFSLYLGELKYSLSFVFIISLESRLTLFYCWSVVDINENRLGKFPVIPVTKEQGVYWQ